jgi:hypothetical protein
MPGGPHPGRVAIGDIVRLAKKGDGIVKYVGKLPSKNGIWCGVELYQPLGLHDGTFAITRTHRRRLFQCKDKHGVFVPLNASIEVVPPEPEIEEPQEQEMLPELNALGQTEQESRWISRGDGLVREVKSAIHEQRYVRAIQQLKEARKSYQKCAPELVTDKLEMVSKLEQMIRKQLIPTAAPSKPMQLLATPLSNSSAALQWEEPRDNGAQITNYMVQVNPPAPATAQTYEFGVVTSAEINSLIPDTTYSFRVKAKNKIGYGIYSNNTDPVSTFGMSIIFALTPPMTDPFQSFVLRYRCTKHMRQFDRGKLRAHLSAAVVGRAGRPRHTHHACEHPGDSCGWQAKRD